jgi:PKD repeat protein
VILYFYLTYKQYIAFIKGGCMNRFSRKIVLGLPCCFITILILSIMSCGGGGDEKPICSSSLITPEYLGCGNVSVTGCVGTGTCINCSVTRFSWDWGDGVVADSWWPAFHHYQANGTYTLTVTAYCSTGETQSSCTTVTITNAEDPLCDYALLVYPTTVLLRRGNTSETLRVELRDADGLPVSLNDKNVSFSNSNPSIVQVDSSGVVSGSGFGEAEINVTVEGFPLTAHTSVFAGEFRIEPPILLLATNGEPTGKLNLIVTNADGSPVDLAGRNVTFNGLNDQVSQVNNNGLVTAIRPPLYEHERPSISAEIDGILSHNNATIVVTSDPLNLNMIALKESNITYYIAQQIGPFNYQQIFQDFDVPRITNIGYELSEELCGLRPYKGDLQYLAHFIAPQQDPTLPCVGNGNPAIFGTAVDNPVNSCLVDPGQPDTPPRWGIIFHEMGHNFTLASRSFGEFANFSDVAKSNFAYIEALASVVYMYVGKMMSERAVEYQIPPDVLSTITKNIHFGTTPDLDAYVNSGANYSTINPSVIFDIALVFANKYGYSILPRFFSVFLPPDAPFDRFGLSKSDANQATFFVAAMSAAAGTDLRADFINVWGFPVDDLTFNQLYPQLTRLIAQHQPVVQ